MRYSLPPEGPLDARIAVVCEKPARDEIVEGRILVGVSGTRVRNHLKLAGLDAGDNHHLSKEVWLTNAVQSFDDIGNPTDGHIIAELPRLYRELCNLPQLRVILGMGGSALKALSNMQYNDITNRRGSRLVTPWGCKFIPTFHPAFYIRGEWRFAPVVQFDTNRAIEESAWPEIRKTQRRYNIRPRSIQEALNWLETIHQQSLKSGWNSFDIETVQGQNGTWYISCIAFATTPTEAFCIPLMYRDRKPYWPNLSDESLIWRKIASVLNLPAVRYVTQNGCAFDGWQLRKHGIVLKEMANGFDTFSAHSLLAPDLPHDLGFLVSIYTDEPFYKDESGRSQSLSGDASESMYWEYNCKDSALTLECAFGIIKDLKEH